MPSSTYYLETDTLLILTRRVGETIRIGNDIEVTVLEVRGKQVRIGIAAPDEVVILRKELCDVETKSAAR